MMAQATIVDNDNIDIDRYKYNINYQFVMFFSDRPLDSTNFV